MRKTVFSFIGFFLICFWFNGTGLAISGKDVVRLKKAGISDETLRLLAKEKTIETRAFSVQELIDMKKAGVDDKTLQVLIKENSFMKNTNPVVYGRDIRPIHLTSVTDIIALKNAGISNRVIRAIIAAIKSPNADEREKAWRLLKDMEIHIDVQETK